MPENQGNEPTAEEEDDDLYTEPKSRPKIIRILTVFAYMSSVSMAAILLSIYYIFMWEGQPSLARRSDPRMEPIIDPISIDHHHSPLIQEDLNKPNLSLGKDLNVKNLNFTLDVLKIDQHENKKELNITLKASKDDKDDNNLNNLPKEFLEDTIKPTIETPTEASTTFVKQEKEEIVEDERDNASLPDQEQVGNKIRKFSNEKFFYKNLILA